MIDDDDEDEWWRWKTMKSFDVQIKAFHWFCFLPTSNFWHKIQPVLAHNTMSMHLKIDVNVLCRVQVTIALAIEFKQLFVQLRIYLWASSSMYQCVANKWNFQNSSFCSLVIWRSTVQHWSVCAFVYVCCIGNVVQQSRVVCANVFATVQCSGCALPAVSRYKPLLGEHCTVTSLMHCIVIAIFIFITIIITITTKSFWGEPCGWPAGSEDSRLHNWLSYFRVDKVFSRMWADTNI